MGYFRGRRQASGDRREQLSRFVSGALRHFPEDAGLGVDGRGWAPYDDLVAAVTDRYGFGHREALDAVIATDRVSPASLDVYEG